MLAHPWDHAADRGERDSADRACLRDPPLAGRSRPEGLPKAFLAVGFGASLGTRRRLPLALGSPGLRGCDLLVSPDKLYPAVATPAGGRNAAATVRIPLANDTALVGQTLTAQWILSGNQGSALTRALEITIQDPDPARGH